ncbi:MAG TPA: hypothetical protein EYQ00_09475 [Dehalococcoidia bacterium]|jgi:hypothetical protein|nr:hypothetical protein [Dehalococcoidia bacterium]
MNIKKDALERLQLLYLDNLNIAMGKLKRIAERTLKKIEEEGVAGYYSSNSEVASTMAAAYRASLGLAEMKKLEMILKKKEKE